MVLAAFHSVVWHFNNVTGAKKDTLQGLSPEKCLFQNLFPINNSSR